MIPKLFATSLEKIQLKDAQLCFDKWYKDNVRGMAVMVPDSDDRKTLQLVTAEAIAKLSHETLAYCANFSEVDRPITTNISQLKEGKGIIMQKFHRIEVFALKKKVEVQNVKTSHIIKP